MSDKIPNPLEAIDKGLDVIKKAQELTDGNITYAFDKQTKRAKNKVEDCECSELKVIRQPFRTVQYVHFTGLYDLANVRIDVRWQYNGCDVIGAIPVLGYAVTRFGWSADLKIVALDNDSIVDSECECCKKAVCVTFQYTVTIDPPFQATRTHSGEITVCANGKSSHTIYN